MQNFDMNDIQAKRENEYVRQLIRQDMVSKIVDDAIENARPKLVQMAQDVIDSLKPQLVQYEDRMNRSVVMNLVVLDPEKVKK